MIAGYVAFAVVVVVIFYLQNRVAREAREWVEHTYVVRERILSVFGKIKDVESAQRGFVLTGDSAYLSPYREAMRDESVKGGLPRGLPQDLSAPVSLPDELEALRALVRDNPVQRRNLDTLEGLVQARLRYADTVIRMRLSRGLDPAVAFVNLGRGREIMERTRGLVGRMLAEEDDNLRFRAAAADKRLRENAIILYSVVAACYFAWLLALLSSRRQRRRRLAAEKETRQNHKLLEAVIHSGSHAIFTTDLAGNVVLFNQAAESMFGLKAAEVVGRPARVALRGIHDRAQVERRRKRLEARMGFPVRGLDLFLIPPGPGEPPDPVWNLYRSNGETFLGAMVVSPLHGRDGALYGYMSAIRDVTARRMMARQLAESNARLDAIVNGTDYAIFAADNEEIVRIVNRGAERLLGISAGDYVGKPARELIRRIFLPEELEARAANILRQHGRPPVGLELFGMPLDSDGPNGQEWTHVRPDGARVIAGYSVSALRDEAGQPQGTVAIARDITQLKALERLKNEFVSTVSHELRTPLTSIRGALGLIAGGAAGPLPEKAAELISIAHRNSERLVHIINDILDIEKIESGRMAIHPEPVEARSFLAQALEANRPYADKHGVRLVLGEVPPDTRVTADPEPLMQVMANLLSNAAKFSPRGAEVRVEAGIRGGALRVGVQDRGPGIPESFRHRIFDKFAQAEGADSRRYEGTGLGLNITKKLVEAMRGRIGFDTRTAGGAASLSGTGTTFWLELPLEAVPDSAAGGKPEGGPAEAQRVLICEDDPDVGKLLRLLLERAGLAADVVGTLAQARERLREGKYAAMTLDLAFPDGSGLGLLRELRREPATRSLPVVVVSARAEEGRQEFSGDAIGIVDWLPKPIDEAQLGEALRRAMRGAVRPRILHVEDDADFRAILARSLNDAADWSGASTVREAGTLLEGTRFDLVVLDLDLPDGSGLELLERLKNAPGGPVPVLILSASEAENGVRSKVEAALVKSRLSEERIVETILAQIRRGHPDTEHPSPGSAPP